MFIIGIAGGSGSGKSTIVQKITEGLPRDSIAVMPQDAYYKDLGHLSPEDRKKVNFDHPSSIDFSFLTEHLKVLASGKAVRMPVYSYITCAREKKTVEILPKKIILVEGILIFANKKLRDRMDLKIFVDADPDERLMRIIRRDTESRGRTMGDVLNHYTKWVKPMHYKFIEPSKQFADIIIPGGGNNRRAINAMLAQVMMLLRAD